MNLEDWLTHISGQNWQTMVLGLERMHAMLDRMALRNPPFEVATIAGTNGKGSTTVALEQICLHSGLKVGATMSPHIFRVNERFRVNGSEVDDATICTALAAVEEARGDTPLTYFEFTALAALWLFRQREVDLAVLEIGLGGRLDAFNGVDAQVAVITSIGLDHQQFLGETREAIGAEKAGVLRADQQVVLGPDMPASVLSRCQALNVRAQRFGVDFWVEDQGASWSIETPDGTAVRGIPHGNIAARNVSLATRAAECLVQQPIDVAQVSFPVIVGRMQTAVSNGRTFICDVAHNPEGLEFLAAQIKRAQLNVRAVVCGMLRDKNHAAFGADLLRHFDAPVYLVGTTGERGLSAPDLLSGINPAAGCFTACEAPRAALAAAVSATQPGDAILVCGSFNTLEQLPLPGA